MNKNTLAIIAVIAIVAIVAVYLKNKQASPTPVSTTTSPLAGLLKSLGI